MPGLLVSMAVADAYGGGFEFADPVFVAANNDLQSYRPHPKGTIKPGCYTDDTQMALGLAGLLLNGDPLTTRNLARHFLAAYKRDPRYGYSQVFQQILNQAKNADGLINRLQPHSDKSGGAMRAAPLGLLPDPRQVVDLAMWQASLTHATRDGMTAAAAAALLVYYCRQGSDPGDLPGLLTTHLPEVTWVSSYLPNQPVSSRGLDVVRAALWALIDDGPFSLAAILQRSVAYTGDVDTVAAIACAAASMHPGIAQDLPQCLLDGLENGPYGRDYLAVVDQQLLNKYPLQETPFMLDPLDLSR